MSTEPVILAIDTTGPLGSLALNADIMQLEAPDGYGAILFESIERLLARNRVKLAQVDCFATASGPGTFTGVRVGIACAEGLAEAMGKPMCAVSNLEAIAEFGAGPVRAVTIDARRGEVYAAVYGPAGQIIVPGKVFTPAAFQASLPLGPIEWVTHSGPLAGAILQVARRQKWVDPSQVDANYLRRTDAELNLGRI